MGTEIKSTQIMHGAVALDTILDEVITRKQNFSAVYDPPAISAGAVITQNFTVTSASLGDYAAVSFSLGSADCEIQAWVSATNTVTVMFRNLGVSTLNLGSGTIKIRIIN